MNEEAVVIFITNKDLNMTETNYVTEYDDGNCFELSYSEKSMYNDPNILMGNRFIFKSWTNSNRWY